MIIYIVFTSLWHTLLKKHKRRILKIVSFAHRMNELAFFAKFFKSRVFLSWWKLFEFISDNFPRTYMLQLHMYMTRLEHILTYKNMFSTVIADFLSFLAQHMKRYF